ncbi:MAG: hypothetical protein Q7T96_18255 [Methylobacter sp.]|nr:hypothetical protein [Methylobacter sp.]
MAQFNWPLTPISAIDGYTAEHWIEVRNIITEAIEGMNEPKFKVNLVSDADDVGVIQKRIVQNIYSSDIIVCDVSGKNPNVMFELGMRLAFDKPTVIVKDDKTEYSFDTGIIEHIPYPRDLRFSKIVTFKNTLADKIKATHKAATTDSNHSTFLKNFGEFKVANLKESIVPADMMVFEMLSELQMDVKRLRRSMSEDENINSLNRSKRNRDIYGTNSRIRMEREGLALITKEIDAYHAEHPEIKLQDLIGRDDFQTFLANRIEGHNYFESGADFRKAIDHVLNEIALINEIL